jgi:two-component system, OmpR family, response regulator VicR
MARILYVEDDPNLSFVTKDNLEEEGFEVLHYKDGKEAFKSFLKEKFDLCLLDVMLPELDGFSLAEKIRAQNNAIPILFLTAKNLQEDKITGLKIGGDDYITKPFSIDELVLRLQIFLKRKQVIQNQASTDLYTIGDFEFCFSQQSLKRDETLTNLTQREAEVLQYLVERQNQIVKREDILKAIWGRDDYFLGRSMDVFVTRIRKMLSVNPQIKIENIHGVGFKLNC